jgi:hypothetical protein
MKTPAFGTLAALLFVTSCGGSNDYECAVTCTAAGITWGQGEDPIAESASSMEGAAAKCESEPAQACGTDTATVVCSCTEAD